MDRERGPYYIDGSGFAGQGLDDDVRNYNNSPEAQMGLWCQWVPNDDGTAIEWDQNEKFYDAVEWMGYLMEHFLGHDPVAKRVDPERFAFLQGHTCNGVIQAQGEDAEDQWLIIVADNQVSTTNLVSVPRVFVEVARIPYPATQVTPQRYAELLTATQQAVDRRKRNERPVG
jgi:hypothetical protein